MRLALVLATAACGSIGHKATPDASDAVDAASDAGRDAGHDDDGDGLDDDLELQLATDYLPYVSLDPGDGCALDGFVVRLRKHPADPTKILIVYDHLLQNDCGLGGHVGDDEVFGVAIDPNLPPPTGILAIRAVSHQGTACERDTQCSTCGGADARTPCDLAPIGNAMWPVVYASKNKHGNYASIAGCPLIGTCLDQCTLNPSPRRAPIVNVGEPDHHTIANLTTQGFITAQNGWTELTLMNFDPWSASDFGTAGNIANDLIDPAFEAAPCPH
jgi:hypothetical protein